MYTRESMAYSFDTGSALNLIAVPHFGQMMLPDAGASNSSTTGTPRAAAIFSRVSIVGLPLIFRVNDVG